MTNNNAARLLPALGIAITLAVSQHGFGAAAVFGSFQGAENAERLRAELAAEPGFGARVVAVTAANGPAYRVVSVDVDEAQARALVARASALGITGAWYWADAPMAQPVQPVRLDIETPVQATAADESATPDPAPAAIEVAHAVEVAPDPDVRPALRLATGDGVVVVPRYEAVDIEIDGNLDEPIWNDVPGHDNMVVVEPDTLAAARFRTVTRFLYTDRGLYVGVWNEQPPDTLIARLSSRDDFINRDGWTLTLDTSGEGLYGYWFGVNLGGSVMDGKVAPERNFSREWDGPWDSATIATADGWSAEMFLPWSMMTMPQTDADRVMGFYASRKVAYIDERWGWPALPFTGARFMSALQPIAVPDVVPKKQFEVFPYAATSLDNRNRNETYSAGADLFWRPSSNFQVTAAALPDFGSVESDDVVINLTARETYFPEKRLFFLEGGEIFATSGRSATSPSGGGSGGFRSNSAGSRRTRSAFQRTPSSVLNTRRIGGAPILMYSDEVDVEGHLLSDPTELLGAAKITGQTGPLRYGVLTAFEDDPRVQATRTDAAGVTTDTAITGAGRNFGVARFLYENAGAGRQAVGYIGTHVDHPLRRATVHGVDAGYLSPDGKLRVELQGLASDVRCTPAGDGMSRTHACPDDSGDPLRGYGGWADFYYTQRQGVQHVVRLDYFDDSLNINDLGFLQRNDQYGGVYGLSMIQTNVLGLRSFGTSISAAHWLNLDGRNTRTGVFLMNTFTLHNRNELRTALRYFPARWEDLESRGNGTYRIGARSAVEIALGTDTSKPVSWSAQLATRDEELGGSGYTFGVGVTFKPLDRFSIDLDINYRDRDGWLRYVGNDGDFATFEASDLQPRLATDLFITARQQLRLTMQWAGIRAKEQELYRIVEDVDRLQPRLREDGAGAEDFTISQLTAQLRYRWQIAPLSDLFVVYTRGSNLGSAYDLDDPLAMPRDGFGELYRDAFAEPLIDLFVVKLRYRFGG